MPAPVWNTTAGSLGLYASATNLSIQLAASPVAPGLFVRYKLQGGELPIGVVIDELGLISGVPAVMPDRKQYDFCIRVTDNLGNFSDRTFYLIIQAPDSPVITTPTGSLITLYDSTWTEIQIEYNNPVSTNPVAIRLIQGQLPPGLEINDAGLIRGYAEPPTQPFRPGPVVTQATATTTDNKIFVLSTSGFTVGRPVLFSDTVFGGLSSTQTYYVKEIINASSFTISSSQDGPEYPLSNETGIMTVLLPNITIDTPTIKTYSFTLKLTSPLGEDIKNYIITVVNVNTPPTQGGPGLPPNSRKPTIYNTRPPTYVYDNDQEFGFYVLPEGSEGNTYLPQEFAYIGQFTSDNYFAFKILGHDFDNNNLTYVYSSLPLGLVGDPDTGWITGTPIISQDTISEFTFSVLVYKSEFSGVTSDTFSFKFRLTNGINGTIYWLDDSDLGNIYNNTYSTKNVEAKLIKTMTGHGGVINETYLPLQYRIVDGSLPPNLFLLPNGEITGVVAFQPTNQILEKNDQTTFTFTIEAYSPTFSILTSRKTFTIDVIQRFDQPTDTLYITSSPSIEDREFLRTLLTSEEIIPSAYLYRPNDVYFGKATTVKYVHAYGIYASSFEQYVAAITRNHYWRDLVLGEIKTAVARNEQGEIIYEVVYSTIIDNLVNPEGISISKNILWPRYIDLHQGPWYTSASDIYTSYIVPRSDSDDMITEQGDFFIVTEPSLKNLGTEIGAPQYYTSLTPGYARVLSPNSLYNMQEQVEEVLGQEYDSALLPAWMTSQQEDGSTLGFTRAWVICYTLPGYAKTVKKNIETKWVDFLGRVVKLNEINFQIDRFTVDKTNTYDYDDNLTPPDWTDLPSSTPPPDPIDSQDFYVLFPRKTILPDRTQYYK